MFKKRHARQKLLAKYPDNQLIQEYWSVYGKAPTDSWCLMLDDVKYINNPTKRNQKRKNLKAVLAQKNDDPQNRTAKLTAIYTEDPWLETDDLKPEPVGRNIAEYDELQTFIEKLDSINHGIFKTSTN